MKVIEIIVSPKGETSARSGMGTDRVGQPLPRPVVPIGAEGVPLAGQRIRG